MNLRLSYDPAVSAISLSSGEKRDVTKTRDLEYSPMTFIDISSEDSHRPVALEVVGIRGNLPVPDNPAYCAETDTLTFGEELETATLVVENGDLVAYWRRYGDSLVAIAVDLRNASRHLAPVVAAMEAEVKGS